MDLEEELLGVLAWRMELMLGWRMTAAGLGMTGLDAKKLAVFGPADELMLSLDSALERVRSGPSSPPNKLGVGACVFRGRAGPPPPPKGAAESLGQQAVVSSFGSSEGTRWDWPAASLACVEVGMKLAAGMAGAVTITGGARRRRR